ncbi:transposase [Dictyobacter aurantiacus]|uniref:Uncharacterized protein n=1 Tax=Dictyobacter aurantiacus TaxID=1936993 RepID=A0A401ZT32_9CHLR|nr:transposase [Dictyobacter aurantiacus]GCE10035.1 hypothetical protein KDAU_73640 [Dictyobacter aurantiacus]
MHIQVSLIVDIDATTDLANMEAQIQAAGHHAMRQGLQQGIRQWELNHRSCPHCSSGQGRIEGTVAQTIQSLFGTVRIARVRIRCQQCFHRFCPAQPLLQPLQRGRVSTALADAACLAGSSWPYRHAAQVLARLSGAQISAEEIRLLTNARGHMVAKEQAQDQPVPVPTTGQQDEGEPHSADRIIIGLDGGWVPNRERRGGMEGKIAVVASHKVIVNEPEAPSGNMSWIELERYVQHHRTPVVSRSRWQKRRYAATFAFTEASVIGQQAAQTVQVLGIEQQEQVVIADGAQWIKTQTQRHFPEATCILDWPHLWRTMIKAVRAVGLQREEDAKWVTAQSKQLRTWLWKGQIEKAQERLQRWQQEGRGHPKVKALQAALTYLKN